MSKVLGHEALNRSIGSKNTWVPKSQDPPTPLPSPLPPPHPPRHAHTENLLDESHFASINKSIKSIAPRIYIELTKVDGTIDERMSHP